MELTSVDVHYLAKEMQAFVQGKIEKIAQSAENKRDLCLTMYVKDLPKVHLRLILPGLMCTHKEKPVYQMVPPGFAMFLRKYLNRATLASVEQRGFDRMLFLNFSGRENWRLVIELIPPGNVLLIHEDGNIKGLLENQAFKDRALRGGIEYQGPPASVDPVSLSDDELIKMIETSDKESIVKTLAMDFALGGVYAEEVCARAGVDKSQKVTNVPNVVKALRELFSQEITPCKDEKRAYPFPMQSRDVKSHAGTFLSALGGFADVQEAETTEKKPKKDKLQTMLVAQEQNIEKQEKKGKEEREKAEKIFEEYAIVEHILKAASVAREKKQDTGEALKKYSQVKKYNPKTKEVEVEL